MSPNLNRSTCSLLTVFLRKYSDASSTEVGTLLMILPFVAVFTKPYVCSLADRHRRYRLYFILALAFTLAGFGPFVVLPFYPKFVADNGRAAWYLLSAFTVIGYIAYGIVWSLGDAYAANVSHKTGESFGMIRLWGTVGWGVAGAVVGALSAYLSLPEMVLGFLVFIATQVFEIVLIAMWPHEGDFEMGDPSDQSRGSNLTHAAVSEKPTLTMPSNQLTMKLDFTECARQHHDPDSGTVGMSAIEERKRIAGLQMTIFKLVARRHKSLAKYLIIFVALGTVYNIHWSYFFLHLEQLAASGKGADFSTLVGLCLIAQAIGETLCFAIAPWVVKRLGRDGAISLNALAYAVRYFGNGLGIPLVSPYVAILTESLQGVNYGIFYYLITDTALHYALLVDDIIPELYERKLIDKKADLGAVRTSLRATMQGIFSGAFDGLGFGLGSLIAGLLLERHSYEELWCFAGAAASVIFVLHATYEIGGAWLRQRRQQQRIGSLGACNKYHGSNIYGA